MGSMKAAEVSRFDSCQMREPGPIIQVIQRNGYAVVARRDLLICEQQPPIPLVAQVAQLGTLLTPGRQTGDFRAQEVQRKPFTNSGVTDGFTYPQMAVVRSPENSVPPEGVIQNVRQY